MLTNLDKTFFILGKPLNTKYGKLNFVKVGQYSDFVQYVGLLNIMNFEIIEGMKKQALINTNGDRFLVNQVFKPFESLSRYNLIMEFKECIYYQGFNELFNMVFEEDNVLEHIENEEEFEFLVSVIMDMNGVKKKKKYKNAELRYFDNLQDELDNKRSNLDWESIYTSVWLSMKEKPDNLTLYQFYAMFFRYSKTMSYFASTLYSTVGETEIINFADPVDVFGDNSKKESLKEFENRVNKINKN